MRKTQLEKGALKHHAKLQNGNRDKQQTERKTNKKLSSREAKKCTPNAPNAQSTQGMHQGGAHRMKKLQHKVSSPSTLPPSHPGSTGWGETMRHLKIRQRVQA